RARTDPRAPERLGDVFDPSYGDAGQIHLDQGLLDRALPAAIAFDDRGLEGLAAQLRDFEADLTGSRLEAALVVTCPGIRPGFAALVASGPAEPVSLRLEHRVQGLFDRAAHHLAQMIPDPCLVDLDHLAHR